MSRILRMETAQHKNPFDFTVVLLHFPMHVVKLNDILVPKIDIDGIHVTLDFRGDVILPTMVAGTLCYVINCPDAHGLQFLAGSGRTVRNGIESASEDLDYVFFFPFLFLNPGAYNTLIIIPTTTT